MKKITCLILTVFLFSVPLMGKASALGNPPRDHTPEQSFTMKAVRAEETEWCFQIVDGQVQRRLWSITYNKWLTDWMPV